MDVFCRETLEILLHPIKSDPIHRCDQDLANGLRIDPEALIRVANKRLHVYPFSDVDICWRRLYTDASIATALLNINTHLFQEGEPGMDCAWLDETVKLLDMALIMTGAPLREELVKDIFAKLQEFLPRDPAPKIRCCQADAFPLDGTRPPDIQYPIARVIMSVVSFEKHLDNPTPLVVLGTLNHWPALHERPWSSPSYLLEQTFDGRRLVPVELGRSYTDDGWGQTIVTFKDFMNTFLLNSEGREIGYLAQHDLFAQIPSLRDDICIPDFCYTDPPQPPAGTPLTYKGTKKLEQPLLNAWFGPAGTISPLHTDPYHNILCQVVGRKYVRLYSPDHTQRLHPRGIEKGNIDMSNTSGIPVEMVEMRLEEDINDEFPGFRDAPYVETILHEGECLYIPIGWWHYVRGLTVSFSVSFWWN
ncbi:hypothetical protein MMC19_002920 [Ptychographa xylographoides]|nr:hypothetical protein [Ptychographa xylographoides]